ncbi:MAG: DEAD/DEAH box helicase [Gemmatimonadota bacterium]|nr:DEAD/DEAH box helicase [Gemmatimonadota bacterium]
MNDNPLIVQSDLTVLADVSAPRYADARDALARFAELVKSPEHIHTYKISALSIWNACAAGMIAGDITGALTEYSRFPIPSSISAQIADFARRFGRVRIERDREDGAGSLLVLASDPVLAEELAHGKQLSALLSERVSPTAFRIRHADRGRIKQALVKAGFPAEDVAGYAGGESLRVPLRSHTRAGAAFALRDYQRDAVHAFHAAGSERGGSGVIVLPCGAGKTIVGMATMAAVEASTLILTTSVSAVRQWMSELRDKTEIPDAMIGEYTGSLKEVLPVTVATYQILTHRTSADAAFTHLALFDQRDWGLIIYDEVHLLPAPVFQITATLQARRRLGLTATLVREDGREDDVFALIGPKKADVPWKVLERQGWIAKAVCTEVRVPLEELRRMPYAVAESRDKFRIASENDNKTQVVRDILALHPGQPALVIGMYVDQLKAIADELHAPLITGSTPQHKRDQLYNNFRSGALPALIVSKVANFAIDLPDASLAIQISGTFGSRQEEAQRLGRILRPKSGDNQAHFYSIVTADTVEQDFALKRQLFLCEQGYEYEIADAAELRVKRVPVALS